ncbi:hypothetical protein ACVDFE_02120 [Lentzea chajnantorensis]
MSLLDQHNAAVVVYPQVLGTDPYGNPQWTPSPDGVPVLAMVWPVSAQELAGTGQQAGEVYRMRPKRGVPCPAGPWAQVEWDGRRWDVEGEPTRYARGRGTRRTVVTLRTQIPRGG